MERLVQRAEGLGHRLTAHAILYPRAELAPEWLSACSEKQAYEDLEEHVRETVTRYRRRISCWHPVNEAYRELQEVGGLRVNEGLLYRWIRDLAPEAELVNNGGHTIDPDFMKKGSKMPKASAAGWMIWGCGAILSYMTLRLWLFTKISGTITEIWRNGMERGFG